MDSLEEPDDINPNARVIGLSSGSTGKNGPTRQQSVTHNLGL